MKRVSLALCVLLLFTVIFTSSACTTYDGYEVKTSYNDMLFWLIAEKTEQGKDYYYVAGKLDKRFVGTYFMPMFVHDLPVRAFGWTGFNSAPMDLDYFVLDKLYMPGTIVEQHNHAYLSNAQENIKIYYCGEVIDLYGIYPYKCDYMINYYVPADKFDEFQDIFAQESEDTPTTSKIYRANIAYRLNCEDMCEYYYVDNVEAGSKTKCST